MKPAHRQRVSEAEYLDAERRSSEKHELINGEIVAMAGGGERHAHIAANIIYALNGRLRERPCVVYTSDLRVNVSATGMYTYPDVSVVCGKRELHPSGSDTLLNPTILVEVLSESTEAYDRGAKFAHYQKLASLREYVLVSQDERRVERYERVEGGSWLYTLFTGDAVVPLPAIEVDLPLAEVYAKVEFAPDAATRTPIAS